MAFNPQISPRGDLHLFQGMSSIADGIGKLSEDLKKQKEEIKKREDERKYSIGILKAMDPEGSKTADYASMDLPSLKATAEAMIGKSARQIQETQAKQMQNQMRQQEAMAQILQETARRGMDPNADTAGYYQQRTMSQGIAPDPDVLKSLRGPDPREEMTKDLELRQLYNSVNQQENAAPKNAMQPVLGSDGKPIPGLGQLNGQNYKQMPDGTWVSMSQGPGSQMKVYGPNGELILDQGQGNLTVGTQTAVQQKNIEIERLLGEAAKLRSTLRPGDVGARGKVGEALVDNFLAQFEGALADPERINNRAVIRQLRESALKMVSGDTRFSNADRAAIAAILPSDGVFESYESAMGKVDALITLLGERGKIYARQLGKESLAEATPEEIKQLYLQGDMSKEAAIGLLQSLHGYGK